MTAKADESNCDNAEASNTALPPSGTQALKMDANSLATACA
jgi:hypothetical protein